MKLAKTEYRGAPALALSTRALELVATTEYGPRIISLRAKDSPKAGNLFFEFPAAEKRYHGYYLRGGHRLWSAPEHIVRTYQPDDSPLAVTLLPRGFSLEQPVEAKTGLQKTIQAEVIGEGTFKVTHRLRNRGQRPLECAPWAVTVMPTGGYGVLPLLPKGSHEGGDLLPAYTLIPWSFTDLALPVWNFRREFIGIDPTRAVSAQKLGISNFPGWVAYWRAGVAFIKYARKVRDAAYPDLGSRVEIFTNGKIIELETLGALKSLEPGRTTVHVEYWTVLSGIPRPSTPAAFSRSLVPRINRWVGSLS
jgi:hypothetical protein